MPEAFLLSCKYPALYSTQGLQLVNLQQPLMDPAPSLCSQRGWAKVLFPQRSIGAWGCRHSPASLPRTASCLPSWNQQPALLANLLTNTSCHPHRVSLWLQCLWGGDVVPMPHTLLGCSEGTWALAHWEVVAMVPTSSPGDR